MIANSSTVAFSSSDGCNAFDQTAGSLNQREDKPASFENVLEQAQNQRSTERPARELSDVKGYDSRSRHVSARASDVTDDQADDTQSADMRQCHPEEDAATPDNSSPDKDCSDVKDTHGRSSRHDKGSAANPTENVSASITLAGLAPLALPAPAIPTAAGEATLQVKALTAPSVSAPIVPQATAVVQSLENSSGIPAETPAPSLEIVTPLISSGNLVDSHSGVSTGSGAGNAIPPLPSLQSAAATATTAVFAGAAAGATTSSDLSIPNVSRNSHSNPPAGSASQIPLETHLGIALPVKTQKSGEAAGKVPAQHSELNETSAESGSKFNGIERLLVVKEKMQGQTSSTIPQTRAASQQNLPTPGLTVTSAQASNGSTNHGPSDAVTAEIVTIASASTPVTVNPDSNTFNISAAAGNDPGVITSTLQGTPAKELSARAEGHAPPIPTDPLTIISAHSTTPAQNSGADTNEDRGSRQYQGQPAASKTHVESLPSGTNAVGIPTAGGTSSIDSTVAGTTTVNQNLERYHIVEQVTRHLDSLRVKNGQGEMTLNLAPAHLGSVRVSISTSQHGVAARITVETSQAQQAMESAKDSLRSALENRGLNLSSLDVSLGQNTSGDSWGNFSRQQERSQEAAGGIAGRLPSPVGAADIALESIMTASNVNHATGSARLDYRA